MVQIPTRRVIKAVIHGFLGTYTSRYSEHEGYWLFGHFYDSPESREIDLKEPPAVEMAPIGQLARRRFAEQLRSNELEPQFVNTARLSISRRNSESRLHASGQIREGGSFEFAVRVEMDDGHVYTGACRFFIAPHDPQMEMQSKQQ